MSGHLFALMGGLGAMSVGRSERVLSTALGVVRGSILHLLVIGAVLALAYALNPTERSFRSFLTDLAFRAHIRRLDDGPKAKAKSSTARDEDDAHVLTFTNRISVSLRTPAYTLTSYGLFSVVRFVGGSMESVLRGPGEASTVTDPNPEAGITAEDEKMLEDSRRLHVFFGAFGRWWPLWELVSDVGDVSADLAQDRLAIGVLAMERLDESASAGSGARADLSAPSANASDAEDIAQTKLAPKRRPAKAVIRGGKRVAPLKPPIHGRKTRSRADSGAKPLSPDAANVLSTSTDKNLPGLPFHTRDRSPPASAAPAAPTSATPLVDAATLVALRTQLDGITTAADARSTTLQAELDMLRARKREEELARSELKTRTRTVDELRREAEHGKLARDRARQAVEVRIASLQRREAELLAREKRALDKRRNAERGEREAAAECAAENRAADLAVARLAGRIEALEHQVEQRNADAILAAIKDHTPIPILPPPGLDHPQWAHRIPSPKRSPPINSAPHFAAAHAIARTTSGPVSAPQAVVAPGPIGSSFLEHRMQHQSSTPSPTSFAPFGSPTPSASPDHAAPRGLALPFFVHGTLTSTDGRNPIDPPTPSSPSAPGPLSPMTPHQSSLIPSHLLDGLDDDDDAALLLAATSHPASPSPLPPARTTATDLFDPARLAWSRAAAEPSGVNKALALNPDAKAFDFRPSPVLSSTKAHAPTPADLWDSMAPAQIQSKRRVARGLAFKPFDA